MRFKIQVKSDSFFIYKTKSMTLVGLTYVYSCKTRKSIQRIPIVSSCGLRPTSKLCCGGMIFLRNFCTVERSKGFGESNARVFRSVNKYYPTYNIEAWCFDVIERYCCNMKRVNCIIHSRLYSKIIYPYNIIT